MSHRLTVSTDIKDREACIDALKANQVGWTESGSVLTLTTAPYNNTTINLKTGQVRSGDVDNSRNADGTRIRQDQVGILRQWYAEHKFRNECMKEGTEILDRQEIMENGKKVILLTWQTG